MASALEVCHAAFARLRARRQLVKSFPKSLDKLPAPCLGLLLLFLAIASLEARRENREEFPAPFTPYGIAYDGGNFWYSDIRAQQIVRIPLVGSTASPQRVSIGDRRIYGMAFNPWDGSLYLGIEKGALRISPLSGGIEARLRLPVDRVAGIAFGPDFWYLLEKGTGSIHVFDPQLQRTVSQLRTGIVGLRDLTYYRDSLWATDPDRGLILRFSPLNGGLTGSLVAPEAGARGLTFADGRLWVVFRGKNAIVRVSFAEQRYFILSGEQRYRMRVRVRFNLPEEGYQGRIVVLQPPNTLTQQISGLRAVSTGWENRDFTASGERVFELARRSSGRVELEYEFNVTVRNVRYLIPPDLRAEPEALRSSPAYYYFGSDEADFNDAGLFERLRSNIVAGPIDGDQLEEIGAAGRWVRLLDLGPAGEARPAEQRFGREAYVPGVGWLPLDQVDAQSEGRVFERNARTIELYRQPDREASGQSAVFLIPAGPVSGARRMRALPATVTAIPVTR